MELKLTNYYDDEVAVTAEIRVWGVESAVKVSRYILDGEKRGWNDPEPEVRVEYMKPVRDYEPELMRVACLHIMDTYNKIMAIKFLRSVTQYGLKEAKDQIEAWTDDRLAYTVRDAL